MNFVLRTHEINNNAKIPKEKIVLQCLRRQEIESYVNELTALHAIYIYIYMYEEMILQQVNIEL